MNKNAIITGVNGQDGSYLAKYLIEKKINVYGIYNNKNFKNLKYLKIYNKINYINCDISNFKKISKYIKKIKPNYFFNLAGISSLEEAYSNPLIADKINNSAVINILECIKKYTNKTRFFQASSSELFSEEKNKLINENSRFNPRSPYAIAKLSAYNYVNMYKKNYNIYAVNGILFNHESPLRKDKFFSKKIIKKLLNYKKNKNQKIIEIGNIESKRDWGNAENYVKAIYKSLTIKKAHNFILCTGKKITAREFINKVAKILNINIYWIKKNSEHLAIDAMNKKTILKTSKKFYRNDNFYNFRGNNKKARKLLDWKPDTDIKKLIKKMINFEINR